MIAISPIFNRIWSTVSSTIWSRSEADWGKP